MGGLPGLGVALCGRRKGSDRLLRSRSSSRREGDSMGKKSSKKKSDKKKDKKDKKKKGKKKK